MNRQRAELVAVEGRELPEEMRCCPQPQSPTEREIPAGRIALEPRVELSRAGQLYYTKVE